MNEGFNMENSNNQQFCLKWNNFENNFRSQFEAFKDDEDFVDVTLYCCGQCIKAHKIVLSACSPYLKNIFKEHPCKHPIIILDSLSFNNLKAVIQFVYTGQVYIEQEELSSFLKAAESLQIKGLSESSNSQSLIENNLPPDNTSNNSVTCKKREAEIEGDGKKLRNKKLIRRESSSGAKENNEFYDEQKNKEREWFVKSEGGSENNNVNVVCEDETFENEEKILNTSTDEDCVPGELKRPHWLDPRSCPLCNRVYSNLSNLRQHMKLIHNPTVVTCKLCYKTFKTDLYLRRHLISFHELSANGNGNGMLSIEPYKPIQNQAPSWNPNVKLEPEAFHEMFNSNEMYQVPQQI